MRFLFSLMLNMFYKRIFVAGLENIPKDKKIILACNHPNTFMDAFIVGVFIEGKMSTLVRSDVFTNSLTSWILGLFRLIPVYRSQEGTKNLKKNELSFKKAVLKLKNGAKILIFSEGTSLQGRRLLRLKKGTARLAFKAEEWLAEDIYVIPVGINYTHYTGFRKEVLLNFGTPLSTKSYPHDPHDNKNNHLIQLTNDLQKGMERTLVLVNDSSQEPLVESLLELQRHTLNYPFFKRIIYSKSRFEQELTWVSKIEKKISEGPLTSQSLTLFKQKLKPFALEDLWPRKNDFGKMGWLYVVLCIPLYIIGFAAHMITLFIGKTVAQKMCKDPEYLTSVWLSTTMVLYLMYNIILWANVSWFTFFTINVLLTLGSFAKYYIDEWIEREIQVTKTNRLLSQAGAWQELELLREKISF